MVIIELASGISGGGGIAHFAHLGGMAAGFIYLKSDRTIRRFFGSIRKRKNQDWDDSWRNPDHRQ
jgi:membrane associated rhomboid family serine protease